MSVAEGVTGVLNLLSVARGPLQPPLRFDLHDPLTLFGPARGLYVVGVTCLYNGSFWEQDDTLRNVGGPDDRLTTPFTGFLPFTVLLSQGPFGGNNKPFTG